ncbi:MAG: cobalt ECF transporter T component CbiQ, partial [Desulfobacterales bacterium]|nr:cobalt ECF transporter T component CbiQ [Desulfobacterales bacterium]
MIEEPFADGKSVIHKIDPRFRVVAAILLSIIIALSSSMDALLAALATAGVTLVAANLDLPKVAGRLAVVAGFLVLLWLVLPVTHKGAPLFTIGPLTLTREGVLLATQITFKSFSILALLIALVATMPVATLGNALNNLGVPGKFTQLLMVSYRYIFVIEQEYQRLQRAAKIRGFQPGTNLHTYRTYAYLAGMLFVRASMRAQRVYQAMLCRGFHGRYISLQAF